MSLRVADVVAGDLMCDHKQRKGVAISEQAGQPANTLTRLVTRQVQVPNPFSDVMLI